MEPDKPAQTEDEPSLSEKQELFLSLVAEYGIRDTDAADAVGMSRWAPPRWRKDPVFKARYDAARKIRTEHLIREAERRAINGSDRLLEFLLLNYAPDKFSNKQKIEHTGEFALTDRLVRGRSRVANSPQDDGSDLAG